MRAPLQDKIITSFLPISPGSHTEMYCHVTKKLWHGATQSNSNPKSFRKLKHTAKAKECILFTLISLFDVHC